MLKLLTKGTASDKSSLQANNDIRHKILDSGTPQLHFTDAKPAKEHLCAQTSMKKKPAHADFRTLTQARPANAQIVEIDSLSSGSDIHRQLLKPKSGFPRITKFT